MALFHRQSMSELSILSVSISFCVFLALRIWPCRWFLMDLVLLSQGPLLSFFSATVIGSGITTTFVLFFSAVWAAANLGYSLAVHSMSEGAEPAIHALPSHMISVKDLNFYLRTVEPIVMLLVTLVVAFLVHITTITDELEISMMLLCFVWLHVGLWLMLLAMEPMYLVILFGKLISPWLLASLLTWVGFSPLLYNLSPILLVLCSYLFMMALVAFLCYNLAIYMHYLETTTPSATTQDNEETLGHACHDSGQKILEPELKILELKILEQKLAILYKDQRMDCGDSLLLA